MEEIKFQEDNNKHFCWIYAKNRQDDFQILICFIILLVHSVKKSQSLKITMAGRHEVLTTLQHVNLFLQKNGHEASSWLAGPDPQ